MSANFVKAKAYEKGDEANTKWGGWKILDKAPSDLSWIRKIIRIDPLNAFSLQSHDHRKELWEVKQGTLTIILDGARRELHEGESVHIPLGSVHTMANLSTAPVVVEELQEGLCDEHDIHRFGTDLYNRATETTDDPVILRSIALFDAILAEIGAKNSGKKS